MKAILILTGTHGSGKTNWVNDNGYNEISLSKNKLRSMLFGVIFNMDNDSWIYNKYGDRVVQDTYLKILEVRLRTGGFIIIDQTITKPRSFNIIDSLAKKYGYTVYVKVFHPSMDECLNNNKNRYSSYEQVPDDLVKDKWRQMNDILIPHLLNKYPRYIIKSLEDIGWDSVNYLYPSPSCDKIHFIGDIHGDMVGLDRFLSKNWNSYDHFVFLGDYVDRGKNNKDVLEEMIHLSQQPNVTVLEGNHELHLWCWSYDRTIVSGEFLNNTKPELEIDPSLKTKVRILLEKLKLYVVIPKYKIIACHGGLSCPIIPDYGVTYPVLDQGSFIRGHRYPIDDSEISDRKFSENSNGWTHIHGHRNNINYAPMNPFPNVYNIDQYNDKLRVISYEVRSNKYITKEY